MTGKWQAWEALLGINPHHRSETDNAHWAQRWAVLEQAAAGDDEQDTVSIDKVVHVLEVLVRTANPESLRTDQSVSQIMGHTRLSERTVKRCLALLRDSELVPVLSNGGGRNKRPAVRWLQFVDEYHQRAQAAVDNSRTQAMTAQTQATEPRTQATSGPPYSLSTEPPTPAAVSAEARAVTGSRSGGQEKAREGTATGDLWADQYAWNVARAVFQHEREQGTADKVRNPDAVIRTRKLPAAQEWVQRLLARSDGASFRLLEASDRDLITWGVGEVLGDGGGVYAAGEACKRAHELAALQRPALGVAL
jgi:hypothetical protein